MRVLFTTWAWRSHLYAMVPLAWACRAAGHDVLVASQPALREEMVATGLPATTVGTDVDAVGMVRGYLLPSAAQPDGAPAAPRTGPGPRAMQMLLAHATSMVDDLVELVKTWRPDVLVFEPTALAGPIAAAAAGIPAVRHLYGTDLLLRAAKILPDVLAPLAARHGAGPFDPFGVATIDPSPASTQLPSAHRRIGMRYVPFNGPGALPEPLPERTGRPRVLVTWGHTMARVAPERFLVGTVAAALRDDAELVVAVSAEQRELLGGRDDRLRILVDVPLSHVVGACDLVVAHGGAGTVLTALDAGVPLLLVPQLPDHAGHAGRVLAAGAGQVLNRDEASPQRLREETARLLTEPAARLAAARLRDEMHAQLPPSAVVAELAALAAG